MRLRMRRRGIAMATVPATLLMAACQLGLRGGDSVECVRRRGCHQYIVVLHNQNSGIASQSAARRTAVADEQKPVLVPASVHRWQ